MPAVYLSFGTCSKSATFPGS